jgi:hypothetical protein
VERPAGSDDVFALCNVVPLEDQSAIVADVVLGKLCDSRRKIAGGHSTILAQQSATGTSRGIGGSSHVITYRQHILTLPIVGSSAPHWVAQIHYYYPSSERSATSAMTGSTNVYLEGV